MFLAPVVNVVLSIFVESIEQARMAIMEVLIVSMPQLFQLRFRATGIHSIIPLHAALFPPSVVLPLYILVWDERLDLLRPRLIAVIRKVSGLRNRRGIEELAIVSQPC